MSPEKVREEKKPAGMDEVLKSTLAATDAIVTVYVLVGLAGFIGIIIACFVAASKGGSN